MPLSMKCPGATSLAGGLILTFTFMAQAYSGRIEGSLDATDPRDRAALALHWAPVHYQDVDPTGIHALGGAADFIARYDFDGDNDARNNWDHAGSGQFPLRAAAYYSVVETRTHWFVLYMFFHPRDWTDSYFDTEHENDSEGLLLSVARDESSFGVLKAAVTVAHSDFFSYLPALSDWSSGAETVDGPLLQVNYAGNPRPVTAQQSKGHGLKAWPQYDIEGGDGVAYYPSLSLGETPLGPDLRAVQYQLIDLLSPGGLWENRDNAKLFDSFGVFAGNTSGSCGNVALACTANAAHAPWAWDDNDDSSEPGSLAVDPAGLVKAYFNIPERVSLQYTFNPYIAGR